MSLYVFRYVCECILNVEHVLYESLAQKLGWQFTGRSKYESFSDVPRAGGSAPMYEKWKFFICFIENYIDKWANRLENILNMNVLSSEMH